MANSNPPVRGQAFTTYIALRNIADPNSFKADPTIASGDFKVKKDAGSPSPLGTLPAVDAAGEVAVKVTLTGTEMTADQVTIIGIDQTNPKEWADFILVINTT